MSVSRDPVTRWTRLAANASAAAVVAYALLWLLTTQVAAIRDISPFADDPWDLFASYAAISLPFVAGPTWIRSLRHRGPVLAPATARRIRWGSGVAALIVIVAASADVHAIVTIGWPADAGRSAGLLTALIGVALATGLAAVALVANAAKVASAWAVAEADTSTFEPDLVDDLLVLATDIARPLGLRRPTRSAADAIERSAASRNRSIASAALRAGRRRPSGRATSVARTRRSSMRSGSNADMSGSHVRRCRGDPRGVRDRGDGGDARRERDADQGGQLAAGTTGVSRPSHRDDRVDVGGGRDDDDDSGRGGAPSDPAGGRRREDRAVVAETPDPGGAAQRRAGRSPHSWRTGPTGPRRTGRWLGCL